jgi:hypothetical protein
MTTFLVFDSDGSPFSVGTILADPLPEGFTYVALTDEQRDGLTHGGGVWDRTTSQLIPAWVPIPDGYPEGAVAAFESDIFESVVDRNVEPPNQGGWVRKQSGKE